MSESKTNRQMVEFMDEWCWNFAKRLRQAIWKANSVTNFRQEVISIPSLQMKVYYPLPQLNDPAREHPPWLTPV